MSLFPVSRITTSQRQDRADARLEGQSRDTRDEYSDLLNQNDPEYDTRLVCAIAVKIGEEINVTAYRAAIDTGTVSQLFIANHLHCGCAMTLVSHQFQSYREPTDY